VVAKGQIPGQAGRRRRPPGRRHRRGRPVLGPRPAGRLPRCNCAPASASTSACRTCSASNFVAGQRLDAAQDQIASANANIQAQQAAIQVATAQLAQARYNQELTIIRAPADGRIARRYANPGAGASTLNVTPMFDLEPQTARIVRAEISRGGHPLRHHRPGGRDQPEADPTKVYTGKVLRRAAVFGARKLQSDDPSRAHRRARGRGGGQRRRRAVPDRPARAGEVHEARRRRPAPSAANTQPDPVAKALPLKG
jgi:hypothetical protein